MRVGNAVNLNARRKNVCDHRFGAERNDPCAQLLSPNKFIPLRIHRKEIALHSDEWPLVAFHRAYEMAPDVFRKKLAMDNVDVFAGIKDHKSEELVGCIEDTGHAQLFPLEEQVNKLRVPFDPTES
jgi:hypothetical protein